MCVIRRPGMRKNPEFDKEELYDVIAALSATIRHLTNEIVELQGIMHNHTRSMHHVCWFLEEAQR